MPNHSKQYQQRTLRGTSGAGGRMIDWTNMLREDVPVDHERGEFVTEEQATARGEAVRWR